MFPPSLENVINSFQLGFFNFISFLGVKMFFVLWLSVWFNFLSTFYWESFVCGDLYA